MQQVRKVERRKCGECRGSNHWEQKCSSVRLWGEGWRLKRKWHEGEERAIRKGVLVERCERGWIKQEQVVMIVKCVDCGVSKAPDHGEDPLGGTMIRTTFETTGVRSARTGGRKRYRT